MPAIRPDSTCKPLGTVPGKMLLRRTTHVITLPWRLQVFGNGGELFEGGFQVVSYLARNDFGAGEAAAYGFWGRFTLRSCPCGLGMAVSSAWIHEACPAKSGSNVQRTMPAWAGLERWRRLKSRRFSVSKTRALVASRAAGSFHCCRASPSRRGQSSSLAVIARSSSGPLARA